MWFRRRTERIMESIDTRNTDSKGRVTLPRGFANASVIVEQVSDTEVRIRKAVVIAEDELAFYEQSSQPLSDRDRERFLDLLDHPPTPTAALKKSARMLKRHGKLAD
jgi:hypothetical protein